ncbi:MAG TPA: histidine phosphatase family protein [Pilimelia sp.]|nr:histidine phosphatase family protein [Pilimelia sp.]
MRTYRCVTEGAPMRLLVHHANAAPLRAGPDEWRGLTPDGHAQASELAERLAALPVERVLSSPSLRCRQTLVPLARRARTDVESCRLLTPAADPAELAEFLREDDTRDAVLCTHRSTLLCLFAHLAGPDSRFVGGLTHLDGLGMWLVHACRDGETRVHFLGLVREPQPASRPTARPAGPGASRRSSPATAPPSAPAVLPAPAAAIRRWP